MRPARGFTLMEVLVAVAIFTVIGVMALSGYNELTNQGVLATKSTARVRQVQGAVFRMVQDFEQLEPRPVREPLGQSMEPALEAKMGTSPLVMFSRAGWSNPAGVQHPTIQRVAYRVEDGKLFRDYWVVMDRTQTLQPISTELLSGVKAASLRFMDMSRQWNEQWPPPGHVSAVPQFPDFRPIAVEITLELEDWGKITRIVEVAG
ncbi:MAG: type II secretion system minor pseudopilin GspJ [Steroidobacteraceae bacterium]